MLLLDYNSLPPNASTTQRLEVGLHIASLAFIDAFSELLLKPNTELSLDDYIDRLDDTIIDLAFAGHAVALAKSRNKLRVEEALSWVKPSQLSVGKVARYKKQGGIGRINLFSPKKEDIQRGIFEDMCERRAFAGTIIIGQNSSYSEDVDAGRIIRARGVLTSRN